MEVRIERLMTQKKKEKKKAKNDVQLFCTSWSYSKWLFLQQRCNHKDDKLYLITQTLTVTVLSRRNQFTIFSCKLNWDFSNNQMSQCFDISEPGESYLWSKLWKNSCLYGKTENFLQPCQIFRFSDGLITVNIFKTSFKGLICLKRKSL